MNAIDTPDDEPTLTDTIREIRQHLDTARDYDTDKHATRALGKVAALQVREDPGLGVQMLREHIESVLVSPEESKPYFVHEALDCLDDIEGAADGCAESASDCITADSERPPEGIRWVNAEEAVLEIPVCHPLVEWMELEAEERGMDSVAEWAYHQLLVILGEDLQTAHGFTAAVDVDIPKDYARRVALYYDHLERMGADPELGDILFNHMQFRPTWMYDGEPWALADMVGENPPRDEEGDDDRA